MPSKLLPLEALLPVPVSRRDAKIKKAEKTLDYGSVLTSLFALLERSSDQYSANVALPEMFADGLACLRAMLRTKGRLELPEEVEQRRSACCDA